VANYLQNGNFGTYLEFAYLKNLDAFVLSAVAFVRTFRLKFRGGTFLNSLNSFVDIRGGTYMFLTFFILLLVSLAFFFLLRNRLDGLNKVKDSESKNTHTNLTKKISILRWVWIISLIGFLLTGANNFFNSHNNEAIKSSHFHGMGYSTDGQRLIMAEHHGLMVYTSGRWSDGLGDNNDYMGFSTYDQGFYSSGHPPLDSNLKNPFGVIRSLDEGETIEPLAYYGQIDFHFLSVGYKSHTIYIYNPHSLEEMDEGLHYSTDEGKSWIRSEATGISGEIKSIAAHPEQSSIVVVGTVGGAYLSKDAGNSFERIIPDQQITGLSFSPQGILYAGTYSDGESSLMEINLSTIETKKLQIPVMIEDAVAFIAVNPMRDKEITLPTIINNVYT